MTKYLEEEFKIRLHNVIECIKSYDIEYLEIGIFGSYAKGEATGRSDIDICLVVTEKPPRQITGALRCDAEELGADVVFVTREYLEGDTTFAKNLRRDWRSIDEE